MQGAGDEEVLLLEPQLLAEDLRVARVEDFRDRLRSVLVQDRLLVVALVEVAQVEVRAGARAPEAQRVHRVAAVPGDRRVVRHAHHLLAAGPADAQVAAVVGVLFDMAAEPDGNAVFRTRDLPGVPEAEPLVRLLHLPPALDLLVEHPELVADAIAVPGDVQGSHRVEVAGRQPPEAAVAEARVDLLLEEVGELEIEHLHRVARDVVHAEVDQVVRQGPSHQELGGQVVHALRVLLVVALLRADPALDQAVADRERKGHVPVERRRRVLVLGE